MSASDYLETKILDHIFNKLAYTAPANLFIGLSTADPLDGGTGLAEPVGNGYARVSTAAADWNSATSGAAKTDNANAITFPQASGSWGTVTHFIISDALSGGNILFSGTVSPSQTISTNNTPNFPAGSLSVTAD